MISPLLLLLLAPPQPRVDIDAPIAGPATIENGGPNAFGQPMPFLAGAERRSFLVGNSFFKQNWVTAPASTSGRDGLGPLFNARSCSSCHMHDGRGDVTDHSSDGLIFHASTNDGTPHPTYGDQIQDDAIHGNNAEGRVTIAYSSRKGAFPDGETYELLEPTYEFRDSAYGDADDLILLPRLAPHLIGLGLLQSVPAADLYALADPEDTDHDGISGRVRELPETLEGHDTAPIGRFGWKASQPTVMHQVAVAFRNDLGITTSLTPDEALTTAQRDKVTYVSGGSPELPFKTLHAVTFYCDMLGVPESRNAADPTVRRGAEIFSQIGCADCHTPTLTVGTDLAGRDGNPPPHPGFAGATIHPYTDLLLHDMGDDLADPGNHPLAREWRTPPLWGLGLHETVNGNTRLLHDGRARTIIEAILWHGGESESSKLRFTELPKEDRDALVAFLESL